VNTMKADRLFPAVITFSGATNVYMNLLGLTAKGAPLVSGAGEQRPAMKDETAMMRLGIRRKVCARNRGNVSSARRQMRGVLESKAATAPMA